MTRSAQSVPDVPLDRTSPVPLYFQVATRLQQLIEDGELPVGSRLENEVELADRLGVSRPTMRRAISYLVERGMLVRRRGIGTQVVHPKVRRPVELSNRVGSGATDSSSVSTSSDDPHRIEWNTASFRDVTPSTSKTAFFPTGT